MKLLTHNLMQSNVKGITQRYPLGIVATAVEVHDNEPNLEFARNMVPKINYAVLLAAARQMSYNDLPDEWPAEDAVDDDLLEKLHHCLVNINIIEGQLVCPESGRVFPIENGIPNMLLREDEV
mmetsp:Transcript_7099/g.17978  ORF Transcript_7099/g.17978 Transcript_7099/m.17978 type:complete len:123 (+) Transcript_7099:209-577(+)|eukprot:CAMPEP_0177635834 /NCGR_PEP_ID=MMETSP0447-20121125/4117_1 /TAXON_ID=0 /ORGANISM="Stygamoeba regulata, Strain BSH-02190019" /LENGTH=122 /DNA_ID=CAMNT_0019137657 /DNA_START=140 /DNA_END=508 /DNA_ORIENTATION=-